jgi:hypothetical protein
MDRTGEIGHRLLPLFRLPAEVALIEVAIIIVAYMIRAFRTVPIVSIDTACTDGAVYTASLPEMDVRCDSFWPDGGPKQSVSNALIMMVASMPGSVRVRKPQRPQVRICGEFIYRRSAKSACSRVQSRKPLYP